MRYYPVTDLNICSVRGCQGQSTTIIQKQIGEEKMMFGYCAFHTIISSQIFTDETNRLAIPFVKLGDNID